MSEKKIEKVKLTKYVEVGLETNSISGKVEIRLPPGAEGVLTHSGTEGDPPTAKFEVELADGAKTVVTSSTLFSSAYEVIGQAVEELEKDETPVEPEPKPEKPVTVEPYRLSFFAIKKGRNRPATNMFQLVTSKLAGLKNEPWQLNPDGVFGDGTDKIARAIQKHYKLTDDGWIGKDSWRAMTADLPPTWRAPLRFRIAECQCTFESGTNGYGFVGAIYREGWFNYGIWNCNRWSAKRMLELGGAPAYLKDVVDKADDAYMVFKTAYEAAKKIEDEDQRDKAKEAALSLKTKAFQVAQPVADWYGSKEGRETQVGEYFRRETLIPSIKNLVNVGFDISNFGISDISELDKVDKIPNQLEPYYERLLTLACDITINSGASGFQPKKTPRAWSGHGDEAWPSDRLPEKEAVKKIYSEVFGQPIPDDYTYIPSDSRDTYRQALKRCLWELCENDEQRIELIAELQSRCIVSTWRSMVIKRRRCVARREGGEFQMSFYCLGEHWGIGI